VDVVHDLDAGPWPFADGAADAINAEHVFEHVADPVLFMTECHRILAAPGRLTIVTPYYKSPDAFTDPTHRRFCTEDSFSYWITGNIYHDHSNQQYGGVSFYSRGPRLIGGSLEIVLVKPPPGGFPPDFVHPVGSELHGSLDGEVDL
jgi:SAM-dependent methyltransferase